MLKIRLQRSGRKKRANYRVVVAEHSAPIQGKYLEVVGSYDPIVEKHGLKFDAEKIEGWIKKGAKPTNTVARLLKGSGINGMEKFIFEMKDRKVKNPKEVAETPAPAAPAAEEAPKEEAPAAEEKAEEAPAPADVPPAEEVKAEEETPKEETPAAEEEKAEEAPATADTPPKEEAA